MLEMEENIKKATKVKKHISPVIITLVLVFVISASAFLLGMKFFSPAYIHTKIEGLSSEEQDLLGDVLAKTMRGLTNIQIAGKTYYEHYCMVCHGNREREMGLMHLIWTPGQKTLPWL